MEPRSGDSPDPPRGERRDLWGHLRAVLAIAVVASALTPGVFAQEGDPADLTVGAFRLEGIDGIDERALRNVLATQGPPLLPWRDRPPFDREAFEVDLRRIVAYYRDHGYPDARVLSRDVSVDRASGEVDITVRIEEGDPLLVEAVALDGFDVLPESRRAALRDELPIAPGDVAVQDLILTGAEQAITALKNDGYAHAEVHVERDRVRATALVVRYVATPGQQAHFGPIEVAGNASVGDGVVLRHLAYRPGDLFNLDLVRQSQRRLHGLDLFEFATVEEIGRSGAAEIPTRVTVAESDHRRLRLSAGWGTEEKVRGEASWRHVNFYGAARVLEFQGKWSSLDSGGEVNFLQPYLLHPNLSLSLNAHALYAEELAYRARSEGGRVAVDGRLGERTTWTVSYTQELARSEISNAALNDLSVRDTLIALGLNPTTGSQRGVLSAFGLALRHRTTDDLLDPSSGYATTLQVERAGRFLNGDFRYTSVGAEAHGYLPLGPAVLAGRLHASTIDPVGDGDVPFYKRYFLGGSGSLRGWGRYEVAPLSGSGLPLGGLSLVEASAEVRMPVWRNLGLVLFADAGNVWREGWAINLDDLRYDVGPGLRYRTPVGPLRLDLAYQLTPIEGLLVDGQPESRRWRVHVSIGQSF
jgi:outer membrane protein assembly complex protein YaeT